MLVQQILKAKSDDGVVTIAPDATVADAAKTLSTRRIGAVVVSRDGKTIAGIVSERDIVREIGRHGPSVLSLPVSDLMTSDIVTIGRQSSSDDALQAMTDGRFRHLPVLEGGEMVGLISIGDVVKARLAELAMEKDALEGMIKGF